MYGFSLLRVKTWAYVLTDLTVMIVIVLIQDLKACTIIINK